MCLCGACMGGLCGGCCACFTGGNKESKTGLLSRLPYICLFIFSCIFAMILYLSEVKDMNLSFDSDGSVYRISFWLFIFELIHVLFIAVGWVSFHWLCFCLKFLIYVAVVAVTFVYGGANSFFKDYAVDFARYVAGIYLLIQILLLITWAYETNEHLQDRANELVDEASSDRDEDERAPSCNIYLVILVGSSLCIYILSFVFLGLFFDWYASGSCTSHETFIILTIVLCIINAVLSGWIGNGSFFVSSIVAIYATFLLYTALQSSTNRSCNQFANENDTVTFWFGALLVFCSISYAALRAEYIAVLFAPPASDDDRESEPLLMADDDGRIGVQKQTEKESDEENERKDDDAKPSSDVDQEREQERERERGQTEAEAEADLTPAQTQKTKKEEVYFHFVLMLAACYVAMVLTNWTSDSGRITKWVNMVCQWLTFFLYWQTLIAPKICPSRFAQQQEEDN